MRSMTDSFMDEEATVSSSNLIQAGTTTVSAVPAMTTTGHCPAPEPRNAVDSRGANRNPITSKNAPIAASNWHQVRFSVALPFHRVSSDHHSDITNAVVNGLAPFLAGVEEGVGLLQVVNRTATLSISSSPTVQSSPTVTLALRRGNAVWGDGQALWLSLRDEARGMSSIADPPLEGSGGSARYDFVFLWADTSYSSFRGSLPEDAGGDISSQNCIEGVDENEASNGIEGEGVSESKEMGGALGEMGRHVVGELRPLNEFSAERQEALDQALETVGVDPRELTEAEAFFGTAALKAYNTFVRPRPKKLSKVMQEPVARAALRTAYQVAFLVRRHRADRAEYLRNKDASMTEAERRGLAPHPVVLVCDNVRSAYNVGSIFRSADTARVAEVITCGFTPHPGGPGEDKLRKTAFGSVDAVAHRHFEDPLDAVESLIDARAFVYALETTEDASSLFDIVFPLPPPPLRSSNQPDSVGGGAGAGDGIDDRGSLLASEALEGPSGRKGLLGKSEAFELPEGGVVALVLGNEVTGVDERVLRRCDRVVEVPVYGLKNSLNVASAGTVVLYEVLRQWAAAGRLAGAEREVDNLSL